MFAFARVIPCEKRKNIETLNVVNALAHGFLHGRSTMYIVIEPFSRSHITLLLYNVNVRNIASSHLAAAAVDSIGKESRDTEIFI